MNIFFFSWVLVSYTTVKLLLNACTCSHEWIYRLINNVVRELTVHARVDTYIGATVDQIAFKVKLHSPLLRAVLDGYFLYHNQGLAVYTHGLFHRSKGVVVNVIIVMGVSTISHGCGMGVVCACISTANSWARGIWTSRCVWTGRSVGRRTICCS